jgi:hypothetical protein
MSNENAAIQINFKTKKDGMLINLRASDVAELDLLIDGLTQRLATLIDLETTTESMATVKTVFPGAEVVNQGAAPMPAHAQPAQYAQPAAQGYAPAPTTAAPSCTGGACGGAPMRLVKAGISKSTGKPYRAFYTCPLPQGQACNNRVNA